MAVPKYKRILLKLSGESLAGDQKFGINLEVLRRFSAEVKKIVDLGVEVALGDDRLFL